MRFIVDTHAFLWAILTPERLPPRTSEIFADQGAELFVSIATPWEMAIKAGIGRLEDGAAILANFESYLTAGSYVFLNASLQQAIQSGLLPRIHKDPFDRLLIAQSLDLGIPIISGDDVLDRYGVRRVWA